MIRQEEEQAIAAVDYFVQLIEQHGLVIVFLNVLVEQLGAPLPTYPVLVMAGALLERSAHSAPLLLALAVGAALIADFIWYTAGRRYGHRLMAMLCRISLSPHSCVSRTESLYRRWGAPSLLIAKFVPGFASIASVLAGALGTGRRRFLLFDGLGAALWAGSAIYLGSLFSTTIDDLLMVLEQLGLWGLMLLGLVFAIFLGRRWWQHARERHAGELPAITVDELQQLLDRGAVPTIVGVHAPCAASGARIPGAVLISSTRPAMPVEPVGNEVVVYCACPNDASASKVARQLLKMGYRKVRMLTGGIDAWVGAGYAVEV